MIYIPHPYQQHSQDHVIDNPAAGLFLDMGLGKTVITLTAIDKLMFDLCEVAKVLVIAPKRVADETWTTESMKWDHLRHLRISKVLGTERQRKEALLVKADIYVINRENVVWLIAHYGGHFPFDMLVIDELSSFKSAKAARFKALRQIRPKISRVIGLTGTPAPNGLLDLWSQMYLLDQGERLGNTLTGYRDRYFRKDPYKSFSKYEIIKEDELIGTDYYERKIYSKIGDICISMTSEDYLSLPERIYNSVRINFPSKTKDLYDEFEKNQILALEDLDEISVVNAAALTNKLLQFSNGAVYDSVGQWHEVHKEKLEALDEIIDTANGQPVLVFYSYRHDQERIKNYLKHHKPSDLKTSADIRKWNEGKTAVLLAHPASAGHGLNLQAGGNIIVWFGLTWSLELYQQANKRLHRPGQTKNVIIHHLIASGTMDEDVMQSLAGKATGQHSLMEAVKARVKKYKSLLVK